MRYSVTRGGSWLIVVDEARVPLKNARILKAVDRAGVEVGVHELRHPEGATFSVDVGGLRLDGVPFIGH